MTSKRWVVIDCGKFPSDDNCQIKLSAPEDQLEKIVELAAYHACRGHQHEDSQELRKHIRNSVEFIQP